MKKRKCKICNSEKDLIFNKKDGKFRGYCKKCEPTYWENLQTKYKKFVKKTKKPKEPRRCQICNIEITNYVSRKVWCSDECKKEYFRLISEKSKKTFRDKYNADYYNQTEGFKKRRHKTWDKKYKNGNPLSDPIVREKRKQTMRDKYDCDTYFGSDTFKEKSIELYGGTNPMMNKDVVARRDKTMMDKYGGVGCASPEIFSKNLKSQYRSKDYILPSGKIIKLQGYEPQMMDILFKEGYKEEDIITGAENIPTFTYITKDGKTHRYYPDIYIISENKIIEVKSEWTYEKDLEINKLDAGYKFKFKILEG